MVPMVPNRYLNSCIIHEDRYPPRHGCSHMGGFNREPPPNGRTEVHYPEGGCPEVKYTETECPETECWYVLTYQCADQQVDHEAWLLEWSLGWTSETDAVSVSVDRDDDGWYRITIDTSVRCREITMSEHRRRIQQLEDRAAPVDVRCNRTETSPCPLLLGAADATEECCP